MKLSEASYAGNIGFEEMFIFTRDAKQADQKKMDRLLDTGKFDQAWELLKRVTGVKLKPMKPRRVENMNLRNVNKSLIEEVNQLNEYFGDDSSVAVELVDFINNDGQLYRGMTTGIHRSLVTYKARGQYSKQKAMKAFLNLATEGAKRYVKQVGGSSDRNAWKTMFDMKVRKIAAGKLLEYFEDEMELGNYDYLLPKKYQKEEKLTRVDEVRRLAEAVASMITVVPAYGRDYKSKKAVEADWKAGKDFIIQDIMSGWDGKPINLPDAKRAGIRQVKVRYKKLRSLVIIDVK